MVILDLSNFGLLCGVCGLAFVGRMLVGVDVRIGG